MQSWFFSWKYADESGRTAAGWNTVDIPLSKNPSQIPSEYIQGVSRETGLEAKKIILVAFNKI